MGRRSNKTLSPTSSYSALLIQKSSLSFMTLARTAPPMKTMSLRRGGSSMRILNLAKRSVSPLRTRSKYNCLISRSRREGRPGYMVEPPERTMCL
eukprot:maker-scaffold1282_size50771-snap-gene-0.20 protein:Tk06946 transcript:maker-scaffold1282_size50771-snap-gene-0.20-mRNA-1 annotation:"hypothetical protein AWRI1631_42080"